MTIHRKRRKSPGGNRGSDSRKNLVTKLLPTRDSSSGKCNAHHSQLRMAFAALTLEELGEWLATMEGKIFLHPSEAKTRQPFGRWSLDPKALFQNEEEH